jgi:hypothetical protein
MGILNDLMNMGKGLDKAEKQALRARVDADLGQPGEWAGAMEAWIKGEQIDEWIKEEQMGGEK